MAGGMFTKSVLFCFCWLGIFAVIFAWIPSGYFVSEDVESDVENRWAIEQFDAMNVTRYDSFGNDSMTFDYSSLDDHPSAPQFLLTGNTYMEVWWGSTIYYDKGLNLRDTKIEWWGRDLRDRAKFYKADGVTPIAEVGTTVILEDVNYGGVDRYDLTENYNAEIDGCVFYAKAPDFTSSIILNYNASDYASIQDAWDAGEISYTTSFEVNWNATSVNAVSLFFQLITFQNPDLGIPGLMGTILNGVIAVPIVVLVAIAIVKLIQSVIPWIKGVED